MTIKWPPKETWIFESRKLEKGKDDIVISAKDGGNPNRARREDRGEER